MRRRIGSTIAFLVWIFFLMVITSSSSVSASTLQLDPQELLINGSLGTDFFQASINVTALDSNITDLNFMPCNLRMITPPGPWAPQFLVSSADIQITPDIKTILKGQTIEYLIKVQNIPRPGQYNGSIFLSYNEQSGGTPETLPISLLAYKFNASPIFLEFEKGLFEIDGISETLPISLFLTDKFNASPSRIFLDFEKRLIETIGGTWPQSRSIELREESGQAPQDTKKYLAKNLNATLEEMVNVDDKSCTFCGSDNFQFGHAIFENDRIILNATFKNPKGDVGKYMGVLTVTPNNSLWPVISIPVEMRIRLMPGWFAFSLIFLGVFISYITTYWNKTERDNKLIKYIIERMREVLGIMKLQNIAIESDKELQSVDDTLNKYPSKNRGNLRNPFALTKAWDEIKGARDKLIIRNKEMRIQISTESLMILEKSSEYSNPLRIIGDFLIALISIFIASFIGYNQLYTSNPIFGAGNSWGYGYLVLLLWGFGVEASAAKAADLLKIFQPKN